MGPGSQTLLQQIIARPASGTMSDLLTAIAPLLPVLDLIPHATIFIKDEQARYVMANRALIERCGLEDLSELLEKTSEDIFPAKFGRTYSEQDRRILRQGSVLAGQLELHLYSAFRPGWCLTHKHPLHDHRGRIIGLAGISLDLQTTSDAHPAYERLAEVDRHIRSHFHRPIKMEELTGLTGLSVSQLERYCKKVFQLTPRQMIVKVRLDHAHRLLQTGLSITDIALQCGYTDHSAFTRQFKSLTGLTPRQYRHAATRTA